MTRPTPFLSSLSLFLLLVMFSSCTKDEEKDASATLVLQMISGDNQLGMPLKELEEPVVVRVVDGKGRPVPDARVSFSTGMNDQVSPRSITTDHDGYARAVWTLGNQGGYTLSASLDGYGGPTFPKKVLYYKNPYIQFSASLEKFTIRKISGDNQKGFPGIILNEPIKIQVVDSKGRPQKDVSVIYTPQTSSGNIYIPYDPSQPYSYYPKTDENGYSEAIWTLGWGNTQTVKVNIEPPYGIGHNQEGIVFTATVNSSIVAGGNGNGPWANQLNQAMDICLDASGNLYIADQQNHRVQKWAPGATSGVTVAGGNGQGNSANQLYLPSGVFVDATGAVYVSDYANHRVQKWLPGATSGITVAGGNGYGNGNNQLSYPRGLFVDAAGNIFIADRSNHRIMKWTQGATSGTRVAGSGLSGSSVTQLNEPNSVVLDAAGNLYIADYGNHRVQKWAPGALNGLTVAGGQGEGQAFNQLDNPSGVFLDAAGNLIISESGNYRTMKYAPGATSGLIVGTGGERAITDAAGNVYVTSSDRIIQWR